MSDSELSRVMEGAKSLVRKVLSDIPVVHESCVSTQGLTLDPSGDSMNLEYMVNLLEIPSAPKLKALAADFTLEMSLNHMAEGLRMYSGLLQVVSGRVASSQTVADLRADINDLQAQVQKIQVLSHVSSVEAQTDVSGLSSRLTSDYEVQVATHVILAHLRSFSQDAFRSLRNIAHTSS
ncbi:colony stimulating factor 3 (granulocyte) b isoform X1 [Alosa sapidissima]|uniref:colony stimulating factor 3 (granulocyte) b isoform X1 n=1 Tax=Alosa sapidissima TaxID=34773 RepID=UPI001C09821D|nr:colony stimulating factor 3 (granulocyte) b isoform X1 [Alosa sapidissima]